MTARIPHANLPKQALAAMMALEGHLARGAIERSLRELVKLRASQLNGCAYCIDMHTKDARAGGEDEQRLFLLSAWRETALYSERERAALEWTEAVTRLGADGPSDDLYRRVRAHFSEAEIADLTFAVIAINGWNRLAIAMRTPAGTYRPGMFDG